VVVDKTTGAIVCTAHAKGRSHDFRVFKQSRLPLIPKIQLLADKGYQGILNLHLNSQTPKKKSKKATLTKADRCYNRTLAQQRVVAEHVNRRLKIWRILSERYRNRRKRFGLRFNLIAGLYNYELALKNRPTPELAP
jgi:IS5 family transposase